MLQPADVAWMRPFKVSYFDKWQNWMTNEPKSFTAADNLQSPGYAKAITWISETWDSFDRQILANSFDQCGITSTSIDDLHIQLKTFVSTSKFVVTFEPAPEVTVEMLFTQPREGNYQDKSFELEIENENEE